MCVRMTIYFFVNNTLCHSLCAERCMALFKTIYLHVAFKLFNRHNNHEPLCNLTMCLPLCLHREKISTLSSSPLPVTRDVCMHVSFVAKFFPFHFHFKLLLIFQNNIVRRYTNSKLPSIWAAWTTAKFHVPFTLHQRTNTSHARIYRVNMA